MSTVEAKATVAEAVPERDVATQPFRLSVMQIVWGVLLVLVLALFVVRFVNEGAYGKDITNFLTGGRLILLGQASELYDLQAQTEAQRPIAGPYEYEGGVLPYIYPPYVAGVFAIFALLPPDVAYYAWTAIQAVLLLLFVGWVMRWFRERGIEAPRALPLALLAFQPVVEVLLQGQTSIINLVLWWWALVAWHNERWAMLGVAVGLTAFKPQMGALLVVALLMDRRWRALAYAVGTQAVLWLVMVLIGGPGIVTGYIEMVRTSATTAGTLGFVPGYMPSLRGLLTILGVSPNDTMWPTLVGWVLGLALTALVWRTSRSLEAKFGLTAVLAVLLSPHMYPHDATLLEVSVVCALLVRASGAAAERRLNVLFVPFAFVFIAMYLLIFQLYTPYTLIVLSVWLLGVVLLWMLWQGGRRAAPARE
ncbi:MAG TPA: glycosyltransferase family 87 protein [Chloroflexia bacterium]|nr:glycosyltransferase family 87 protein [Chloroflexia bacterium]